jgi:hypothetical protein
VCSEQNVIGSSYISKFLSGRFPFDFTQHSFSSVLEPVELFFCYQRQNGQVYVHCVNYGNEDDCLTDPALFLWESGSTLEMNGKAC